MYIQGAFLIFNDSIERDESIDTLNAYGMSGLEGQRDRCTLSLEFYDHLTAVTAYQVLNTTIFEEMAC